MVKAFHKKLRGKIKIKRKPRPIGTEVKAVCDGKTKIAVQLEINEGKDIMHNKEFFHEHRRKTKQFGTVDSVDLLTHCAPQKLGESALNCTGCMVSLRRDTSKRTAKACEK
jgi:hypothetical protein